MKAKREEELTGSKWEQIVGGAGEKGLVQW